MGLAGDRRRVAEYEHLTARHPGARFAPAAFIGGALFTEGIATRYAKLTQAVWLAHGVRGEFTDFGGLLRIGPPKNWSWEPFGTGAMPQLEAPRLFMSRYDSFLERVAVNAVPVNANANASAVQARAADAFDSGAVRNVRRWSPATASASR